MGDAPPPTSSMPAPEQLPAKKRQRGNLRTKRATEEEEDAPPASTSTGGAGAEGEGVQGPGSRGASAEEVQRCVLRPGSGSGSACMQPSGARAPAGRQARAHAWHGTLMRPRAEHAGTSWRSCGCCTGCGAGWAARMRPR